jgi:hypothetical protein
VEEGAVKQDEDFADLACCLRDALPLGETEMRDVRLFLAADKQLHSLPRAVSLKRGKTVNECCDGQPLPVPWLFLVRNATVVKPDHGEQNVRIYK